MTSNQSAIRCYITYALETESLKPTGEIQPDISDVVQVR
jgi:hypothetical protein